MTSPCWQRTTSLLHPFLRSLRIKPGSFDVLAPVYPQLGGTMRSGVGAVRYLPPPRVALPEGPVPIRCVVFPRYVAGAATALTPVRRTEVLPRLIEGLCNPRHQIDSLLPRLVDLLGGADCYTLVSGDLDQAVRLCVPRLYGVATATPHQAGRNEQWLRSTNVHPRWMAMPGPPIFPGGRTKSTPIPWRTNWCSSIHVKARGTR